MVMRNVSSSSEGKLFAGQTLCLLACFALMGCSAAVIQEEARFEPYSGSDAHPIKVSGGKAYTEKCGDWSEDSTYSPTNSHMKNHGCAVQQNIAAMIADPNDIAHPNRRTLGLGDRHATAVTAVSLPVGGTTSTGASSTTGSSGGQ
jgi:type IV pilus biogenesis protein CpaD/CtpE